MTPTARTLAKLRRLGSVAAIVEKFNPHAKIRQDLFGLWDIVHLLPGSTGVHGVQCTTGAHVADRLKKLKDNPVLQLWLSCGNSGAVWGWSKQGKRGKRKTWEVRIVPF